MRTMRHGVTLFIAFLVSSSSPAFGQSCTGDCDGNGAVAVNELIRCVTIVLGSAELEACSSCDGNGAEFRKIDLLNLLLNLKQIPSGVLTVVIRLSVKPRLSQADTYER